MTFFNQVYELLKTIPKGKVVSYGDIARALGKPRASRIVGYALHVNPDPYHIPCYKVVNKDGRLAPAFAFGGEEAQKALLESEGIKVENGYVDMGKYRFDGWD